MKEYLEEMIDLKRPCTIKFKSVEGGIATIRAHVVSMEEVSGRYMIETDAGFSIGLDQLISVNDRPADEYC